MAKITIDEDQFPRNSKTYREPAQDKSKERPRLKPVTKVKPEENIGKAFIKEFVGDKEEINNYIVKDLLIPGIKNGILSVLGMMFFKDDYVNERRNGRHDYRSDYRRGSSRNTRSRDRDRDDRSSKVDPTNIQFHTRADADSVCGSLRGRIREYGSTSIGDLCDLIDVSPDFTDWDFGWTREEDIGVRRLSNGRWLLDVTKPIEL